MGMGCLPVLRLGSRELLSVSTGNKLDCPSGTHSQPSYHNTPLIPLTKKGQLPCHLLGDDCIENSDNLCWFVHTGGGGCILRLMLPGQDTQTDDPACHVRVISMTEPSAAAVL